MMTGGDRTVKLKAGGGVSASPGGVSTRVKMRFLIGWGIDWLVIGQEITQ